MKSKLSMLQITRRQLLSRAMQSTALVVIGGNFIAAHNAAWASEVTHISAHEMATLLQMARDIYPHDQIGDEYYVIAIKGYDSEAHKATVADGIKALDQASNSAGYNNYLDIGWEADRVAVLKSIEESAFFQSIRGGLVTGLYNQKAVWPIFGYEGESFSKGGYLNRGFDDISWI